MSGVKKILILGAKGYVGSSIYKHLLDKKYNVFSDKKINLKADYTKKNTLNKIINKIKPNIIINCAAKVGGLQWGADKKIKNFYENVEIINNILQESSNKNIWLINSMANCVYAYNHKIWSEEKIYLGDVHDSVYSYATTRRLLMSASKIYNQSNSLKVTNLIFANIFGPYDHMDPFKTHALSGLILRFLQAQKNNDSKIEIWGTGSPKRDWLYIDDACNAIVKLINNKKIAYENINIASNNVISIKKLSFKIKKILNWTGEIIFNENYPDGDLVKSFDTTIAKKYLKWESKITLDKGILNTINYYRKKLT